jgi:hypothetical protein
MIRDGIEMLLCHVKGRESPKDHSRIPGIPLRSQVTEIGDLTREPPPAQPSWRARLMISDRWSARPSAMSTLERSRPSTSTMALRARRLRR